MHLPLPFSRVSERRELGWRWMARERYSPLPDLLTGRRRLEEVLRKLARPWALARKVERWTVGGQSQSSRFLTCRASPSKPAALPNRPGPRPVVPTARPSIAAAPTSLSPAARAAGTFRRSSAPWGSLRSSALQTGGLHAVTYRHSAPDNSIAGCSASK